MDAGKRGGLLSLLALGLVACGQVPYFDDEPAARVERPRQERGGSRSQASKSQIPPPPVSPPEATPALRLDVATPQLKPPERQSYILFAEGSSTLDAQGRTQLQQHAQKLKANPAAVVTLVGYVPQVAGSKAYLQAIVEQRLDAVVAELRAQGVAKRQIRRQSAVDDRSLARACGNAGCRAMMERVELSFSEG